MAPAVRSPPVRLRRGALKMADPNNAGPFDVSPADPIAAGDTYRVRFGDVEAGPAGKPGYLEKVYGKREGLDYLFVVNNSPNLLKIESQGGTTFVPGATSQNIDEGPYRYAYVSNEGSSDVNTDSSDKVSVLVGNGEREPEEGARFSASNLVGDLVPGFRI